MEGIEARFATRDLGGEIAGISYQRFDPNTRLPFGHTHEKQEEIYVIVSGGGRAKVGDDVVELKAWDALRVSPGTVRSFESGPDGLELLAFGAPAGKEVEMVQDWWGGDS